MYKVLPFCGENHIWLEEYSSDGRLQFPSAGEQPPKQTPSRTSPFQQPERGHVNFSQGISPAAGGAAGVIFTTRTYRGSEHIIETSGIFKASYNACLLNLKKCMFSGYWKLLKPTNCVRSYNLLFTIFYYFDMKSQAVDDLIFDFSDEVRHTVLIGVTSRTNKVALDRKIKK